MSEKDLNKKKWQIVACIPLLVFILILFEEKLFLKPLVPIILKKHSLILSFILVTFIVPLFKNRKEIMRLRGRECGFLEDIFLVCKEIKRICARCTVIWVLLMFDIFILYIPALAAENNFLGRTYAMVKAMDIADFKAGAEAFKNYNEGGDIEEKGEEDSEDEKINESGTFAPIEKKQETQNLTEDEHQKTDNEIINEENMKIEKNEDYRLVVLAKEKKLIFYLDKESYDDVYFEGKYKINDWDDKRKIGEAVEEKVKVLVSQNQENKFDVKEGGPPEQLQNSIYKASLEEENTKDLKGRKDILAIRIEAYQSYPKYSLAKMIAEGYNLFGLVYCWQCKNFLMAKYYFEMSIVWLEKALTFKDNSDDINKELLICIAQRYKDIAYVCSDDQIESFYSLYLSEAYEEIAQRREVYIDDGQAERY